MVIEGACDNNTVSDVDNDDDEITECNIVDTHPPSFSEILAMLDGIDGIQTYADMQDSEDLGIMIEKLVTVVERIRIKEKKQSDIRLFLE